MEKRGTHSTFNIKHSTFLVLPEPHLVDFPPFRPVFRLVVCPRRVFRLWNSRFGTEKLCDERRGGFEVFAMIGDIDAVAAFPQDATDFGQRFGSNDAPLLFPSLRPRIGKIYVYF